MIQHDGTTLFYIDANGQRVEARLFQGTAYQDMLTVMDAQIQASRRNNAAYSSYAGAVANAQGTIDIGRTPEPLPVPPLMMVVSDTGATTYVPFDPPLPKLVVPAPIPPPPPFQRDTSDDDKLASIYIMVSALYRKEFPE